MFLWNVSVSPREWNDRFPSSIGAYPTAGGSQNFGLTGGPFVPGLKWRKVVCGGRVSGEYGFVGPAPTRHWWRITSKKKGHPREGGPSVTRLCQADGLHAHPPATDDREANGTRDEQQHGARLGDELEMSDTRTRDDS